MCHKVHIIDVDNMFRRMIPTQARMAATRAATAAKAQREAGDGTAPKSAAAARTLAALYDGLQEITKIDENGVIVDKATDTDATATDDEAIIGKQDEVVEELADKSGAPKEATEESEKTVPKEAVIDETGAGDNEEVDFGAGDNEEVDDVRLDEEGEAIKGIKKRIQQKRLVGSAAKSIKQMKDSVVRAQAVIAASKVATVQKMTRYKSDTQSFNNPPSETYLLNFDGIVPRPDKADEGERVRKVPVWTLLLPGDVDQRVLGFELEKLGKSLQEQSEKKKPSKGKKREAPEYNLSINYSPEAYLESIYGKKEKKAK